MSVIVRVRDEILSFLFPSLKVMSQGTSRKDDF